MKNASLIDAMKSNVNYLIQTIALMYRISSTQRQLIIFDEHVIMWLKIDRELRQIRHIISKLNVISIIIINVSKRLNSSSAVASTVFSTIKAFASFLALCQSYTYSET